MRWKNLWTWSKFSNTVNAIDNRKIIRTLNTNLFVSSHLRMFHVSVEENFCLLYQKSRKIIVEMILNEFIELISHSNNFIISLLIAKKSDFAFAVLRWLMKIYYQSLWWLSNVKDLLLPLFWIFLLFKCRKLWSELISFLSCSL